MSMNVGRVDPLNTMHIIAKRLQESNKWGKFAEKTDFNDRADTLYHVGKAFGGQVSQLLSMEKITTP